MQILSEHGFTRGIRPVLRQLRDCRSEYSVRYDAADRPELVTASGRVFPCHELSELVTQSLNVNQPTQRQIVHRSGAEIRPPSTAAPLRETDGRRGQQNL